MHNACGYCSDRNFANHFSFYVEKLVGLVRRADALFVCVVSFYNCIHSSQGTQKQVTDKCHYYQVECLMVEDSEALSTAIGKHNRKSVAILNAGFAKKLKEKLGVGEENGETK